MADTASHLPPVTDDLEFQPSSPHSLNEPFSSPPAPPLDLPSDVHYDIAHPPLETEEHLPSDHDLTQISLDDRRISTHSSISSFPASVVHHEPPGQQRTHSRPPLLHTIRHESIGSFGDPNTSPRRRGYAAAFRNPSSVRAMQMKDEQGDDSESITPHRRSGSQFSVRSHGSAHSARTSPSKRYNRSSQSSPLKNSGTIQKEFPLVLLHCTLLPPASSVLSAHCDSELFSALLPDEYRKRWTALQERLAMAEVKARGVLIPHPQEDYELLEERLLECLELEKPRIRANHFFHRDKTGADSGFESASQTEEESENDVPPEFKCPDCGKEVQDRGRKWEIKVYAANGLMRAGAWAAAWREMEKVDIEIGLWLPEDVRQEVVARLEALRGSEHDADPPSQSQEADYQDLREREVYGADHHNGRHSSSEVVFEEPRRANPITPWSHTAAQRSATSFMEYLERGTSSLLRDRKNALIIVLSIIIMYVIAGRKSEGLEMSRSAAADAKLPEASTATITSTAVLTSTMTLENEGFTSSELFAHESARQQLPDPGPIVFTESEQEPLRAECEGSTTDTGSSAAPDDLDPGL